MLETVIKGKNKKYYPQPLLKECRYEIKKKKMVNLINDDFDPSSSDESDNEGSNGFDSEESNLSDNEESNGSDSEESND